MSKQLLWIVVPFLVVAYQGCSGVNFSGGNNSSTVAIPNNDNLNPNNLDGGTALCFDYADENGSGPCSTSLSQTKVSVMNNINGDHVIRIEFPTEFVDNTYGINAIGWGNGGHTYKQLDGSDHVEFLLTDAAGNEIMQPKIDFISEEKKNAGQFSTGVDKMELGDEADVLDVRTSMSENFLTHGYILTEDSPATDVNYTPNATYPEWEFSVWYEVTVSAAAFQAGGGLGQVQITSIHASPSKIDENTCEVVPAPCL